MRKHILQRVVSFLLAIAMAALLFPVTETKVAAATPTEGTISVDNAKAFAGGKAVVKVNLENNPGITAMRIYVSYDDSMLTLEDVVYNPAMGGQTATELSNPSALYWNESFVNYSENGVFATLTFAVSENATVGDKFDIRVTHNAEDIYNADEINVPFVVQSGQIQIVSKVAGDINGDGVCNPKDTTRLMRYLVGWDVQVNQSALDVNGDGKCNPKDTTRLMRYLVGWDVDVYIDGVLAEVCAHTMEKVPYTAATCESTGIYPHYHCSKCGKNFNNQNGSKELVSIVEPAKGHNSISYDAVPATPTTEGYTAGVWCDKCETWLHGHEVIPPIDPDESNISYRHYVRKENSNGTVEIVYDVYLDTHGINNPNPVTYVEGTGVAELIEGVPINNQKVSASGYSFLGWYDKPETNAKRVYSISAEEKGDKVLYGVWSKDVYTITYLPDSASSILPKVEDDFYTVDKETSLSEPPQWPNLVWVGWSDENGKIIKSIPKGTTGDITLTANWMSRRSQTVPNTKYVSSTPAITIDEEKGIYAFTYEIGDIQNVPIQQIEDGVNGKGFNLTKGQTHEINQTFTQKVEQGEATSVADTIANATTKSDAWTLSEDWSKSATFSEEHSSEVTHEQSQKAALSFSESGKYSLSSGVGGSEEHIDESGTSTKTTSKHEFGVSVNAGVQAGLKAGITKGTPFKNASVSANVGLDYRYSKETEKETHETHTDKTSSYWNVNEGFETSQTLSQTAEFASSLSQSIKDTYGYSETLDFGGSSSNTVSSSNTSSKSREYASSVTYSTEEGKSYTIVETLTADAETGYYRKVLAANFKVFAVVIYNMKTNSFSTMTYSLKIKDSEHLFTDYSTVSSFNDYENGVLPFEVPAFVSDYVYGLVGASEGLKVDDETGIVESYGFKDPSTGICYKKYDEYTGTYSEPCDTDVIIPRYVVVSVSNNEKKIVPVTGIAASAFSGTTVTSVYLSDKITEIPTGAFENCKSLKYVRGGTIDTIGANAFKNCTSLFEFVLPDIVTDLGNNAFMNVDALTVNVATPAVLDSALNSGVKALTVDLATMADTIDGKKIITPATMEYFCISGGGKVYNNVSLDSSANTVVLNNLTINNNVDVPLKLTGANVELGFVTISADSLIMRLDADDTYITLDGNNRLISSGENALLSKNIRFLEKSSSSATGKVHVTGNALVYGSANGVQRVSFNNSAHNFVYLTEEEYTNMLNSHYVHFDANGGTVGVESKMLLWGSQIGTLPEPVMDFHNFLGWYTETDNLVTEETVFSEISDITLYAKWELKPLSDWVKASEVPSDAQSVEKKWTYTKTTTTESRETSLAGYNQIGSRWVESGRGSVNYSTEFHPGFDTNHWIYTSFNKAPLTGYEDATSKRTVVSNNWAGYVYWGWMYSGTGYANTTKRMTSPYYGRWDAYGNKGKGENFIYFSAFTSTVDCPYLDKLYCCSQNLAGYNCHNILPTKTNVTNPRHFRFNYYTSNYVDYYKLFTYQKVENLESATEVSASDTISNVQGWVRYREK